MKEVNIISKVVGRSGAEASPSSAILPNMSGYATKTELNTLRDEFKDFLEGADADVIINKWQDLVSFLEGISEDFDLLSMLGLKADKSELSNYVTIATEQAISGKKDFINGLSIGGLPITKSQDDVIYLDANLVVRGGITMFGTNSVDVPTIMDAIATDNVNLKVVDGVLTFVGSSGGGLSEVYWDDIKLKPTFASVATSGKYADLSGKPTLLSSFTDDVVAGKYLPLSGGDIKGTVTIYNTSSSPYSVDFLIRRTPSVIAFLNAKGDKLGYLGFESADTPCMYDSTGVNTSKKVLWHEGNLNPSNYLLASAYTASDILVKLKTVDGSGSGLDADLLDGLQPSALSVFSASKLTTPRTIWGRSFDGTGNVDGNLKFGGDYSIQNSLGESVFHAYNNYTIVGHDNCPNGKRTYIDGYDIYLRSGYSREEGVVITSDGRVGIGSKNPARALVISNKDAEGIEFTWDKKYGNILTYNRATGEYKPCVISASAVEIGISSNAASLLVTGKVGVGTTSPEYNLDVVGDIRSTTKVRTPNVTIGGISVYKSQDGVLYVDGNLAVRGGITMYSTDKIDVPSIIEALPIASTSSKGIASFNPSDFSVVNGYVSFIGQTGVDESVLSSSLSNYLPLVGGTLTGTVVIAATTAKPYGATLKIARSPSVIHFWSAGETESLGYLGFESADTPCMYDSTGVNTSKKVLWHEGNLNPSNYLLASAYTASDILVKLKTVDGSGSGLDADLLDGLQPSALSVFSASKLTTPRTIWGQSFDGTGNVSGALSGATTGAFSSNVTIGGMLEVTGKSTFGNLITINSSGYGGQLRVNRTDAAGGSAIVFSNSVDGIVGYIGVSGSTTIGGIAPHYEDQNSVSHRLFHSGSSLEWDAGNTYNIGTPEKTTNQVLTASISSGINNNLYLYTGSNGTKLVFGKGNHKSGSEQWGGWLNGLFGIGTTVPEYPLHVIGDIYTSGSIVGNGFTINSTPYSNGYISYLQLRYLELSWYVECNRYYMFLGQAQEKALRIDENGYAYSPVYTDGRYARFSSGGINIYAASGNVGWTAGIEAYNNAGTTSQAIVKVYGIGDTISYIYLGGGYSTPWAKIDSSKNLLVGGGITMYSDIRKKTKLQDVELSLKQIADAPLIEHYYNSDEKRTTHVGSIAQYWAGLNDWFCKLDSEGYYTMEIQNAALASAISIARELVKYESKTDRKIRLLKQRVKELEDKIENLI